MHKTGQRPSRRFCLAGLTLVSVATLPAVHGQEAPSLPSNVPLPGVAAAAPPTGVRFVTPPPPGFNPLTASVPLKAIYAIPPAPPASAPAKLRSDWQRAIDIAASGASFSTPTLSQTLVSHRPAQKLGRPAPIEGTRNSVAAQSSNWSGNSVVNNANPLPSVAVVGEFVVPTARQAFGSCSGGWDYSSLWPGIDGNGSNDVLQGGVEVDAYCSGNTTATLYSAWVEWYPYNETRVSAPAMHPGDLVLVEVWNTSATTGCVWFYNLSTQQTATYALTAPGGTTLVGNSVEWIVERPGINGGLANLTNYVDAAWPVGFAWNTAGANAPDIYDGQDPASGVLETITMLDNANNPISSSIIENSEFL